MPKKIKIVYTHKDRLFLKLPGVSSITIGITISRFASYPIYAPESGLPLLESLAVTEKVVGNSIAALEISEARRGIEAGERIAPAFLKSRVFPKMIVSMIETGEESGALVEILEKLGSYYDQDVEISITRMASLLEPALITVVGIMVGFIALSIYLPLFGLSGSL